MSLRLHLPAGSVVVAGALSHDLSRTAEVCLRAARLATAISAYAPHPRVSRHADGIEIGAGDDARVVWTQRNATRGERPARWQTALRMWEPMSCGDSLRTLSVELPDDVSPDMAQPEGIAEIARFLTEAAAACRTATSCDPLAWLPAAIAASATSMPQVGVLTPPCPWFGPFWSEDLEAVLPPAVRTDLASVLPIVVLLHADIEDTEEGMEIHRLSIRPHPFTVLPVDPLTGLRALAELDRHRSRGS